MNDIRVLAMTARTHWASVLACVLAGILLAALVNLVLAVGYTATARLFVATPNWNDSTAIADPNLRGGFVTYGDEFTQQRMVSYNKLGMSDLVLDAAAKQLGGSVTVAELRDRVSVRTVPETVMVDVRATASSAASAANTANAVAAALTDAIKNLERPDRNLVSPVQPLIVNPAVPPPSPSSPQLLLNLLVGVSAGGLAGLTFAAWRTGTRLRSVAAVAEMLHSGAALGVVPLGVDETGAVSADGSAQFLALRLLQVLKRDSANIVLLASPQGKVSAARLAELMARIFFETGVRAETIGTRDGDDEPSTVDIEAERFARESTDYLFVVVDGLLESANSVQVAAYCDAVILVCPLPETTTNECAEAEKLITLIGTRYLGTVVTTPAEQGAQELELTESLP